MKYLVYLLLLSPCLVKSQSIDSAVAKIATTAIGKSIILFATTLDSNIVKNKPSTIALSPIDTLFVPIGFVTTFFIELTAENASTQETGGGFKMVMVKNLNGQYFITVNEDMAKYQGQTSIANYTWSVVSPNNGPPVIQVSGKAIAMKFNIYRFQNVVKL